MGVAARLEDVPMLTRVLPWIAQDNAAATEGY
jgi:hypothetical protein